MWPYNNYTRPRININFSDYIKTYIVMQLFSEIISEIIALDLLHAKTIIFLIHYMVGNLCDGLCIDLPTSLTECTCKSHL